MDAISSYLTVESHYDVIAISETWLDESVNEENLELSGYVLFRKDRLTRGGGVCIYVANHIPVKRLYELEHVNVEAIWLELKLNTKRLLFATYYRPPLAEGQTVEVIDNFISRLHSSISDALVYNPDSLVILGDFNDSCTDWYGRHSNSELGLKLVNLLDSNNLFQIVNQPTRYTETSANILDLIITDSPGFITKWDVLPPLVNLDHCLITCEHAFKYSQDRVFFRDVWKYDSGNYEELNRDLSLAPWNTLPPSFETIDDRVDYFNNLLLDAAKYHIPFYKIKIRPHDKPYITHACRKADKIRDRWHKKFQKTRNINDYEAFKEKRRIAKITRHSAKQDYDLRMYKKLSDPNVSSKDYWKTAKSIMGVKVKPGIPPLINDNIIYSTNLEKANILNQYFANQSKIETPPMALPPLKLTTHSLLDSLNVTSSEVSDIIKLLDVNKANGPDCISSRLIKQVINAITLPLTDLFNKSLALGKVPLIWKKAHVTPVYKKGDSNIVSNYRPISLLSIIGKILERIVFKHLYNFCKDNKLLTWRNSGFKPLDSAMNQLIYMTDIIYKALEQGSDVCTVYMDISKAFDKVWHTGLIHKLEQNGIVGSLLEWFKDYIRDRQQRVVINGQASDWVNIGAGVPQGSILGPLLFLIYINDIVLDIKSDIYLFADDTSLLKIIRHPQQSILELNADLETLSTWAGQWAVTFNATKTVYTIISRKIVPIQYDPIVLNGIELNRVDEHCHLGCIINKHMSWESHIRSKIKKAAPRINLLKRSALKFPRSCKVNIYKTFIRPVLEYGGVLYDNCPEYLSKLLEKSQKNAAIICSGAYQSTSYTKLLTELGWATLKQRRQYYKLTVMYKIINSHVPHYLRESLSFASETTYNLRDQRPLHVPFGRTVSYIKSFFPSSIRWWNNTSISIRSSPSLSIFKKTLKHSLFPESNPLNSYGTGRGAIHQARMRMGLSGLNFHRHSYNFISSPKCENCGHRKEDPLHYLLVCPSYTTARTGMLEIIAPLIHHIIPTTNIDIIPMSQKKRLTHILLYGTEDLNVTENTAIFDIVQTFISQTERFR